MERIALRVREGALDEALDGLLVLLPGGVHDDEADDGVVELSAYGDRLPPTDELLAAVPPDALAGEPDRRTVPADWRERRRLFGRGVTVGSIHVRSSYDREPDDERLVDVVLEAREGAFGGGAHVTTQLMLALMEELTPEGGFADLGCGTGTLAIAAAKLGWSPVLALDRDERSVLATRDNVKRNGVNVEVQRLDLLEAPPPALPTLVANIPPAVHRRVAARLDPAVRRVLVTGLTDEDAQPTLDRYVDAGLTIVTAANASNWSAALLERA